MWQRRGGHEYSDPSRNQKERRGRPRSRQIGKAILKAAAEIAMESGLAEMSME